MKKKTPFLIALVFFVVPYLALAQAPNETQKDTTSKIKTPKGFSFGAVPTITYDTDLGFQYGALVDLYDYGDGSIYPEYKHRLKMEVSRFTKGSGINQVFYDSKYLLPHKTRFTAELSYLTDKAFDFYGFNGYQSIYSSGFTNKDDADYISRMFYKHDRKLFRFTTDFQGNLYGEKLRWVAGLAIINTKVDTVNTTSLNKNKKADKMLPVGVENLYKDYVDWGLLNAAEKDGGSTNYFKLGLVYDTRDKEASPTKGVWEEALLVVAPKFFFNKEFSFTKLVLIHREYFRLIPDKLTLCYRLGYQGTIGGQAPFFFEPTMVFSYGLGDNTGLGGSKTLRGIIRDRVVGSGIAYGNIEMRWKFLKTHLWKSSLDFSLHGFGDAGMVVQKFNIDENKIPLAQRTRLFNFNYDKDKLHPSAGAGLRIALNENFIIAVDYGFAFKKQDGATGLYIGIGNLF